MSNVIFEISIFSDRVEVSSKVVLNVEDENPCGDYKKLEDAVQAVKKTGEKFTIFDVLKQEYVKK